MPDAIQSVALSLESREQLDVGQGKPAGFQTDSIDWKERLLRAGYRWSRLGGPIAQHRGGGVEPNAWSVACSLRSRAEGYHAAEDQGKI